jgi:hypothetical protein
MKREYQLVRPSNFNLQLIKSQTLSLSTFLSFYSDKLIVSTPTISQLAYLVVPPRKHCQSYTINEMYIMFLIFIFYFSLYYQTKYPMYLPFPIIFPLCLSLKIVELFGTQLSDLTKCGVPYTSARM